MNIQVKEIQITRRKFFTADSITPAVSIGAAVTITAEISNGPCSAEVRFTVEEDSVVKVGSVPDYEATVREQMEYIVR